MTHLFTKRIQPIRRSEGLSSPPAAQPRARKIIFFTAGSAFVVGVTFIAAYSSYELYKTRSPAYQEKMAQRRTEEITKAVGKIMELPGDAPQIATVSDVEVLRQNQPFFERAQNGDQLLVFQSQAILYRPGSGKIINVAAVNRGQPQPTVSTVPVPSGMDLKLKKE